MTLFVIIFYVIEHNGRIKWIELKKLAASKRYIKYKDIFNFGKFFLYVLISAAMLIYLVYSSRLGISEALLGRLIYSELYKPRPTAIAAERWKPYFEDENPYFIEQGRGIDYATMTYELIPYSKLANYNTYHFRISTEPVFDGDIFTLVITPEEWEKYVLTNGYKLLYIYKSDEILETKYGHFFRNGVQEDMCYYVQNEEGHLVLVPVVE
jgi:hypothetical protein